MLQISRGGFSLRNLLFYIKQWTTLLRLTHCSRLPRDLSLPLQLFPCPVVLIQDTPGWFPPSNPLSPQFASLPRIPPCTSQSSLQVRSFRSRRPATFSFSMFPTRTLPAVSSVGLVQQSSVSPRSFSPICLTISCRAFSGKTDFSSPTENALPK